MIRKHSLWRKLLLAISLLFASVGVGVAAEVTPASALLSNCGYIWGTTSASSRCLAGSGLQRVWLRYHANFCNCDLQGFGPWAGIGQWSTKTCTDCYVVSWWREFSG